MQTLTLSRATLGYIIVTALAISCLQPSFGQGPPLLPVLTSISVTSNGGSPSVSFKFDRDVHTFSASSYVLTTTIGGGSPQNSAPTLAPISAISPNTVQVPLDLTTILAFDTAQINLTLADNNTPATIEHLPGYSPDLSIFRSLKALQDQVASLQQDKQTLQASLTASGLQLQNLLRNLSPTVLNALPEDLVGDTAVVLHYTTDIYSKVIVTNTTLSKVYPADVGTDHHIHIEGLSPNTAYSFQIAALDISGQPIPALTRTESITTKASVPLVPAMSLSAQNPTNIKVSINFDPGGVFPPNFKAYCTLQYRLVIDATTGTFGEWQTTGDGAVNSVGVPQGTAFVGSHDFQIPGTAGKQYQVRFTAFDEYGHVATAPNILSVTLPQQPPAFDFDGPISVTLNTKTGIAVSLKANAAIATASLKMTFSDVDLTFPNQTQSIAASTATLNTGEDGLVSAVTAAQKDPTVAPTITVAMTGKDGSTKTQSFIVKFVVAGAPANATPGVAQANAKLQQAASPNSGTKIKWSDVLAAGLSVIVKAL
jgi:hypothetical protein